MSGCHVAERRLKQASTNLATYRDNDRIRNLFGDDTFLAGLEIRRERLRDARLAFGAAEARRATPTIPPVAELRDTWPELDVLTQRALLEQLIACVFVARSAWNRGL